ncbi:hypothetical protein V1521DRAFT_478359 [Lipomyces starkeyi]
MSTASTSASIPISEFRLQSSKKSSGASYHSIKGLILRSEDDATRADKVAITFSGCMPDVFGIDDYMDSAKVFVNIDKFLSRIPAVILQQIMTNFKRFVHARSLLIIPSISHAIRMIHEFYLPSTDDSINNLDLLALLYFRAGGNSSVQLLMTIEQFARAWMASISYNTFSGRHMHFRMMETYTSPVESPFAPDAIYKFIGNARYLRSLAGRPKDAFLSEVLQLTKEFRQNSKVTI